MQIIIIYSDFWYYLCSFSHITYHISHLTGAVALMTNDCTKSCAVVQSNDQGVPQFSWDNRGFRDPSALNIWDVAGSYQNAEVNVNKYFVKTFFISECHKCMIDSSVTATLYVCVDDIVEVNLDGNLIGTYRFNPSCQGQQSTISFGKGLHTLMFSAVNTGGPAGLEFALYCQDSLLMHSDGSWCFGLDCESTESNVISTCSSGTTFSEKNSSKYYF